MIKSLKDLLLGMRKNQPEPYEINPCSEISITTADASNSSYPRPSISALQQLANPLGAIMNSHAGGSQLAGGPVNATWYGQAVHGSSQAFYDNWLMLHTSGKPFKWITLGVEMKEFANFLSSKWLDRYFKTRLYLGKLITMNQAFHFSHESEENSILQIYSGTNKQLPPTSHSGNLLLIAEIKPSGKDYHYLHLVFTDSSGILSLRDITKLEAVIKTGFNLPQFNFAEIHIRECRAFNQVPITPELPPALTSEELKTIKHLLVTYSNESI